ncbi:Peptidase G1 [Fusarium oxysporum f. sp. vasinfectum]|nr:Peptidase G1 [Fusarium oxysporum f. sp. vasinfectum]
MKFLSKVLLFCALANSATLAIPQSKQFTSSNFLLESRAQHQTRDVKNRTSYIWNGGEVAGPRFASVTAEVIIPNITFPYGYNASARYGSSVWVGIGGDQNTCDDPARINNGGLIQGGYYYLYDPEGDFGVFAFYEWFPDGPVFLDDTEGIETAIGDHVRMTVTQKDNVTGTFTWENFTSDKKFTKELKAPVNGTLCTNHAEWIVESFMTTKDHETLFPDFGELHFTGIKAISVANEEVSLQEYGIIVEAEPVLGNGKYLTDCEITGLDATTCKWLGYKGIFES